jgi:hypothetical protein
MAPLRPGRRHRSSRGFSLWTLVLAIAALLAIATVARGADGSKGPVPASLASLLGEWRIVGSVPAPWADATPAIAAIAIGARIRLAPERLEGPQPIGCGAARFERFEAPPEGLFEANLPDPERDAARLGFHAGLVACVRAICANASLDFHLVDPWTMVFGLDNRIYTLSRAPGALAAADTPEGSAQRLLQGHFAGDRGFSDAAWAAKRGALAPLLAEALDAYFAVDWPVDEPAPINGDPLTMSQESATRFAVFDAEINDGIARVPVRFADRATDWQVVLQLERGHAGWLLTDVVDARGERFSTWLVERP